MWLTQHDFYTTYSTTIANVNKENDVWTSTHRHIFPEHLNESTMDAIGKNVNNYAGSYYGTVDCYRDAGCQHKKITELNWKDLTITEFINVDDCEEHTRMCSDLKAMLGDIKHRHKK